MATTLAAIRSSLVTAIDALTPSTHASVTYTFAPRLEVGADLRAWAESNDAAAWRVYDLVAGAFDPVGVWDQVAQRRAQRVELVVAYPHHYGIAGPLNESDLHDMAEADVVQLLGAVGLQGAGNYPAGAVPVAVEHRVEVGDGITYGVLDLTVEYMREVA
jgi:hypothetical protein